MNFQQATKFASIVKKTLNLFNNQGTSLPGKLVSKVYPRFLSETQNYATSYKFAITGTNGKTTTAGLLAHILKQNQKTVIHNDLGANMPNGIITSLALGMNQAFKKYGENATVDNFVIEADEAYLNQITKNISFDYLLVTNLFKDQSDRYSEVDYTKEKIRCGIKFNPNLKLVLNAYDPYLFNIDKNIENDLLNKRDERQKIYFGVENIEYIDYEANSPANEIIYCPNCKKPLKYSKTFYSQVGHWHCDCSTSRKTPDVNADIKIYKDYSILNIKYKDLSFEIKLNLIGLYNAYNALGAIACALCANVKPQIIKEAIENFKPAFGRDEHVVYKNREVAFYLIKNPTGANEVLRGLKNLQNARIMISINDNYADGRDISWLWDTNFEILANFENKIYLTGIRADDMALRLKYAGVDPLNMVICNDIKKTFEYAINELEQNEKLVILPTYTSLLKLNKLIKK